MIKELVEENRLNEDDLRYLLNRIEEWHDLWSVCEYTPLISYILNEFVLNKSLK